MSEEPSDSSKEEPSRTAESFATWLSLFGVTPSGSPVPAKTSPPKKRSRTDRAPSPSEDAPA